MKPCTVNDNAQSDESPKQDIYARITATIVAALEDGVRPWVKPWNAEYAAGRITRPLRHGQPYTGINILSLWASASVQGFCLSSSAQWHDAPGDRAARSSTSRRQRRLSPTRRTRDWSSRRLPGARTDR